jgi:hypothetical protein
VLLLFLLLARGAAGSQQQLYPSREIFFLSFSLHIWIGKRRSYEEHAAVSFFFFFLVVG